MSLHNLKKQARKILNQNHEALTKRQIKKLSSPQQKEQLKKQGFEGEVYKWRVLSNIDNVTEKRQKPRRYPVGWQKKYPLEVRKRPKFETEEQSVKENEIIRKLDKIGPKRYLSKKDYIYVYGEDEWEKNKDNFELFTY